jgi:ABC-type branched-subunit amino acid transport system ATPase component
MLMMVSKPYLIGRNGGYFTTIRRTKMGHLWSKTGYIDPIQNNVNQRTNSNTCILTDLKFWIQFIDY